MKTKIFTGCLDESGRKVYVGDKIQFLFWVPGSDGCAHEKYYIGHIRRRKGRFVFAYKPDGIHISERRLSALRFDSQTDWKILTI